MKDPRLNRPLRFYDVDGTLCKEICWNEKQCLSATPVRKVIEHINSHHDDSITVIWTARRDDLIPATLKWLRKHGVHYWFFSNQKHPAEFMYDDHATHPDML